MSDLRKNLKELAQLSLLANRISETQAYNLKMWPFVFFEKVKEVKIEYDLGHGIDEKSKEIHHSSFMTYYLVVDEGYEVNTKRCSMLETAVRDLFWKDIKVQVYFNNKLAYESADVK